MTGKSTYSRNSSDIGRAERKRIHEANKEAGPGYCVFFDESQRRSGAPSYPARGAVTLGLNVLIAHQFLWG